MTAETKAASRRNEGDTCSAHHCHMTPIAQFVVGVVFSASAPAYAFEDVGACPAPGAGASAGTVESVREAPPARDLHAFDADLLEHRIRPEPEEELVVRLDLGPLVVFTQRQSHRLQAGERVRVTLDGGVAQVERDRCFAPLVQRDPQRLF